MTEFTVLNILIKQLIYNNFIIKTNEVIAFTKSKMSVFVFFSPANKLKTFSIVCRIHKKELKKKMWYVLNEH